MEAFKLLTVTLVVDLVVLVNAVKSFIAPFGHVVADLRLVAREVRRDAVCKTIKDVIVNYGSLVTIKCLLKSIH